MPWSRRRVDGVVAMALERTSSRRRRGGDHHSRAAVKGAARDMID